MNRRLLIVCCLLAERRPVIDPCIGKQRLEDACLLEVGAPKASPVHQGILENRPFEIRIPEVSIGEYRIHKCRFSADGVPEHRRGEVDAHRLRIVEMCISKHRVLGGHVPERCLRQPGVTEINFAARGCRQVGITEVSPSERGLGEVTIFERSSNGGDILTVGPGQISRIQSSRLIDDPVAKEAVDTLDALVNTSTGITHSSDRSTCIEIFKTLHSNGISFDPETVRAWLVAERDGIRIMLMMSRRSPKASRRVNTSSTIEAA